MRKLSETLHSLRKDLGRVTGLRSFWDNLQQGFREYKAWLLMAGAVLGFVIVLWLFKSTLWHIGDTYRLLANIHKSIGVTFLVVLFAAFGWLGHFLWKTWRSVRLEQEEELAEALAAAEADFNASDPSRYLPAISLPPLSFFDLFQPGHHKLMLELAQARSPQHYQEVLSQLQGLSDAQQQPEWKLSEASVLLAMGRVEQGLQLLVEVQETYPRTMHARDARSLVVATCLEFSLPPSRYRPKSPLQKKTTQVQKTASTVQKASKTLVSSLTKVVLPKPSPSVEKPEAVKAPPAHVVETSATKEPETQSIVADAERPASSDKADSSELFSSPHPPLEEMAPQVLPSASSPPAQRKDETNEPIAAQVEKETPLSTATPLRVVDVLEDSEALDDFLEHLFDDEDEELGLEELGALSTALRASNSTVVPENNDDVSFKSSLSAPKLSGDEGEEELVLAVEIVSPDTAPEPTEPLMQEPEPEPVIVTLGGIPLDEVLLLEKLLDEADRLRGAGERARSDQLFEEILQRAPHTRYAKDVRLRQLSEALFFKTSRAHQS
jgi:hypothetical protein